jgi:hypothetical protein
MSVINTQPLAGSSGQATGYNIERSLRLRSSASAYLNRTPASAGSRTTWTWSAWVKRCDSSTNRPLFTAYSDASNRDVLQFDSTIIQYVNISGGSANTNLATTQVFRDPSAWYHIVFVADTTQATSSNRFKLYVNGTQVTAFGTATYPAQNTNTMINNNVGNYIGREVNGSQYAEQYMTDVRFIDGQALTPSSFGETDTITGVWKPKRYVGTYGTNGFYLPFTDVATTSGSNAGLGKDFSGNGNYFTTNNISVTAGATYDSMTDVPTLTSATAANFATLNPLAFQSAAPTAGNLDGNGTNNCTATIACPSTGKYYFEMTMTNAGASGQIGIFATTCPITSLTAGTMLYTTEGRLYENDVLISSSYATFTNGDTVAVAVNMDTGQVSFYKNNTLQGTRSFVSQITSSSPIFAVRLNSGVTASANFGQRPFAYTPPSGYVALNTYNLPDSTIKAGNKYMDATIYTGDGTNKSITNAGAFKPDLVWVKSRSNAEWNILFDSVRGTGKSIYTNDTGAEVTNAGNGYVSAFNSNGYAVTAGGSGIVNVNGNAYTYDAWQWQAGQGTNTTNTSGSITSTVSVNASAGFSVVTYTGTGANATVGHGLGVAPKMVIIKGRGTTFDWRVWHTSFATGYDIQLNTSAASASAPTVFTSAPTSSVINIGTGTAINQSSATYVAYCWSEISGFSKMGSYTGNGSTDGPFVYTGFRPKFILTKRTDATSDWWIQDTARSPRNASNALLFPNLANAEYTTAGVEFDILSNGFKPRNTGHNISSGTYIYMAFAESPFKNSLAR